MTEHTARDTTYHDPLDSFTDRENILALFEQLLRSAQPGQLRVLAIKGNSGIGKTFLTEYLSKRICPLLGWETGQLRFFQSQPDFRTILTGLEDVLKGCVARASLDQLCRLLGISVLKKRPLWLNQFLFLAIHISQVARRFPP
jgi:hypothetical protein